MGYHGDFLQIVKIFHLFKADKLRYTNQEKIAADLRAECEEI